MEIAILILFALFDVLLIFVVKLLLKIIKQTKTTMLSQKDAAVKIDGLTTQLGKISTEVQALKDALANQENVSPEVEAALGRLEAAVTGVDDLNPDAPTP